MKYVLLLISSLALSGCSSLVPVKPEFPSAPKTLMEPCPPLKKLKRDAKLSDVAKNVTENYTQYHECSAKHEAWVEWYETQKNIFDELK